MNENVKNAYETLASVQHDIWSDWMDYLFSKCYPETGQFDKDTGNLIIPKELVDRWKRQLDTPYKELTEEEKDSDREQADKVIAALSKFDLQDK